MLEKIVDNKSGPSILRDMSTDIRQQVARFLERHQMAPTTFGTLAMNDPSFVARLEKGRDVKLSTVTRLLTFMNEYKNE